jgi:hypothetical protein
MRIRRTKVTVVKEHVFVLAEHCSPIQIECEQCGARTRIIRLDKASVEFGNNYEAIRREVEADGFHFTVEVDGSLLICLGPLQRDLLIRSGIRRFF